MDYDDDGDLDLLSGSYTGELYLFERGADGKFAPGRYLNHRDGGPLKVGESVTVEAVDVDGDGDLDLVIGTRMSGAQIVDNLGTRSAPVWAPQPRPVKTKSGKKVYGSNAHVADWDRDGTNDLILGSERGGVTWHRNQGTNAAPVYAEAAVLVAPHVALDRPKRGDTPKGPGERTKVHVGDWNHDGVLDLLVGDFTWVDYQLPPLTAEERAAQEALRPAYDLAKAEQQAMNEERQKFSRARQPPTAEFLQRYNAMRERTRPTMAAWATFRRERTETHGFVWVFPGQAVGAGSVVATPGAADAPASGPTSLAVEISPVVGKPGTFALTATVEIEDGWHLYGKAPAGYASAKAALEPTVGVDRVVDWQATTDAHAATDGSDATWYEHKVVFTCEVQVAKDAAMRLPVTVALQACNATLCLPPVILRRFVELPPR